jgi:hypothetical protein
MRIGPSVNDCPVRGRDAKDCAARTALSVSAGPLFMSSATPELVEIPLALHQYLTDALCDTGLWENRACKMPLKKARYSAAKHLLAALTMPICKLVHYRRSPRKHQTDKGSTHCENC